MLQRTLDEEKHADEVLLRSRNALTEAPRQRKFAIIRKGSLELPLFIFNTVPEFAVLPSSRVGVTIAPEGCNNEKYS